jgi:hypothetical protein
MISFFFLVFRREFRNHSCEWFYSHLQKRFHDFGSAKVIKSVGFNSKYNLAPAFNGCFRETRNLELALIERMKKFEKKCQFYQPFGVNELAHGVWCKSCNSLSPENYCAQLNYYAQLELRFLKI